MFTVFNELVGVEYITSQIIGYSFGIMNSFIFNKNGLLKNVKLVRRYYMNLCSL